MASHDEDPSKAVYANLLPGATVVGVMTNADARQIFGSLPIVGPIKTVQPEYKCDSAGRLVPLANVKAEHLLEEELVLELLAEAERRSLELAEFKARAFEKVDSFLALVAQTYGAKRGGAKGNVTLHSYDGNSKVTVAVGDTMTFGPELQAAKDLIDECLTEWVKGGNPNLRTLINDAFDVEKEGKLRTDRILGLRRLEIDDPRWKRAMDAIGDALRVQSSTRYLRFHRKRGQEFEQVSLDVSRL